MDLPLFYLQIAFRFSSIIIFIAAYSRGFAAQKDCIFC